MKLSLAAARVNAGLTQQNVQDKTGISRCTVISWEHGYNKPQKKNREIICALYGLREEDIDWEGTEHPFPCR